MSAELKREINLDDVLAFNQQLVNLSAAGLPFAVVETDSDQTLAERLAQIEAKLAVRLGSSKSGESGSLEQLLQDNSTVPSQYRSALETWVHGDRPTEALEALSAEAASLSELRADVGYSLVQPAIVCGLVYLGFIYLISATAPKLEAIYAQLRAAPSMSLSLLTTARHWLPIWGPALPLAAVIAALVWHFGSKHWRFAWIPGQMQAIDATRKANYADSLARLIDQQCALGQALELIGPLPSSMASGHVLAAANERIIAAQQQQCALTYNDPALAALPALLRFALTSGDASDDSDSANLLRFAAQTYRDSARQQTARWRNWLPASMGALIGGSLVLAFGVSLFAPMVQLLKTLTTP